MAMSNPPRADGARRPLRALLVGESAYLRTRLAGILEVQGFQVVLPPATEACELALLDLPGGVEQAHQLASTTALVGVAPDLEALAGEVPWPFAALVAPGISDERVAQICGDVVFHRLNRRRAVRFPIEVDVLVRGSDRALVTCTKNFSEGGTFVLSLNPFAVGSQVVLSRFQAPGLEEIRARVVYAIRPDEGRIVAMTTGRTVISHPGMALQFLEGQEKVIGRWMLSLRLA
jgi:hypothetical protein